MQKQRSSISFTEDFCLRCVYGENTDKYYDKLKDHMF